MPPNETETPPGWAAIDGALQPVYGNAKPKHYGTLIPYRAGGPDPLDGISAYLNERPSPHWHLISYGLTELREKESPNKSVSGFGFELTVRVAATSKEEPPLWVPGLLQSLARYTYTTGKYFEPGHFFELGEDLAPDAAGFSSVAFRREPQLSVIKGPFGAFEFLQVVPLRRDEVRLLKSWNTLGLLEVMAKADPLLIANPARPSVARDPAALKEIATGRERDGSATPRLRFSTGGWQRSPWSSDVELTLAPEDLADLAAVIGGRIPFGRPLELFVGDAQAPSVTLVPSEAPSVAAGAPTLRLAVPSALGKKMAADLSAGSGPWRWPELPNLVLQTAGAAR